MSKKEKKARSLKSLIISGLGKVWMWWPPRLAVKKRCKHPTKSGWFVCEKNSSHIVERLDVDHIRPIIKPEEGFVDWNTYISSRFVEDPKLLQGLCRDCHKEKSKQENLIRKMKKKKEVTSADLDKFAETFPDSQTFDTGKTIKFDVNGSESSGC